MSTDKFILTGEALDRALPGMSLATKAIHADDFYSPHRAIAPSMHVAVNYRYSRDPANLKYMENHDPNAPHDSHIYSRYTAPNATRLEKVLQHIFGAHVVAYSTGLSAFQGILLLLNPKRIFITEGYHGVHGVIDLMARLTGLKKMTLEEVDQAQAGDIIHVETPVNPTGEVRNLAYYKEKAAACGAYLSVDATFAPPPLQDPIQFGADIVIHSGTKYVGGHSDMLCGLLVVNPEREKEGWTTTLKKDRAITGSVLGSFEAWLGIRSVRTLQLRIHRQADNALKLVQWLAEEMTKPDSVVSKTIEKVQHSSLQHDAIQEGWLAKQMPGGHSPVFSIVMKTKAQAQCLPSRMYVFQHATSLGGVESLMELRALSDKVCDERLIRVSCGIEEAKDLQVDVIQGLQSVLKDYLELAIQDKVLVVRTLIGLQREKSETAVFDATEGPIRHKCHKVQCSKFATGCPTEAALSEHLAVHDRPFRCPHADCFRHRIGYPSPKRLESHNEAFHHSESRTKVVFPSDLETGKWNLYEAYKAGDLNEVKRVHREGAALKSILSKIGSPLCAAVEAVHGSICQYLVYNGVEPFHGGSRSVTARTPVVAAMYRERWEILEFFLHSGNGPSDPELAKNIARAIHANSPAALNMLLSIRNSGDNADVIKLVLGEIISQTYLRLIRKDDHPINTTLIHTWFQYFKPEFYNEKGAFIAQSDCAEYKTWGDIIFRQANCLHRALDARSYSFATFLMDIGNDENI
ncbi:cystathionine beta-lyase [Fusarium pseudocircinatum]|uniref:Cystathionine beta-lyase n=1 Tax=Fusarium pseudocircinatum TaxID=56676 RepID=A0A8H5L195_9HYPO|nr:cystathionine beta-lyase [Fusarium pseudocircinatum]